MSEPMEISKTEEKKEEIKSDSGPLGSDNGESTSNKKKRKKGGADGHRESVKKQKKVVPMTEKRIAQLSAAREARSKKAAERRAQKEGPRLVKGDGEAAGRYLETLKATSPEVDIEKSQPKTARSKRKPCPEDTQFDFKTAMCLGLGLLGATAATYVAGKNRNPGALKSGFTNTGSGFGPDPVTGDPAIPVQQVMNPDPVRLPPITVPSTPSGNSAPSYG